MPISFFASTAVARSPDPSPTLNCTLPRVGDASRAAVRNRGVFPAPLAPNNATNSPERIWSEMPRRATNDPKRFSTPSKEMPKGETSVPGVTGVPGRASRLASHQIAQTFFHLPPLALVIVLGDGPGLAAQLQTEEAVF